MPQVVLLDTHTWIWWVGGAMDHLTPRAIELISEAPGVVSVASVSCLEVTWLHQKGRVKLVGDLRTWFRAALVTANIELSHLTPDIAA